MGGRLVIYHGTLGRPKLRELCTGFGHIAQHGAMWTPDKMTPTACRWALDNGAYEAYKKGEEWDTEAWHGTIERAKQLIENEQMPLPDFAVLPDVLGDPDETYRRSELHTSDIPERWDYYFALQDGMFLPYACQYAKDLGATGVFVGGSSEWKRRVGKVAVELAHENDLKCHIARPSLPEGLNWCKKIGADSCDTTSIVTNPERRYLSKFEKQSTLSDYGRRP